MIDRIHEFFGALAAGMTPKLAPRRDPELEFEHDVSPLDTVGMQPRPPRVSAPPPAAPAAPRR